MFVTGLWKHWPVMQSQWSVVGRDFLFHSTTCWYSEESIPTRLIPQWVSEMPTSGDLKSGDFFSDQHPSWSNLPMRPPSRKCPFLTCSLLSQLPFWRSSPPTTAPPPLLYFFQLCQPICHLSRGVHISPVYTERYRVIFDIVFITLWFPNFIRILTPFIKVRNSGQEESSRLMSTAKSPFF